MQEIRCPNCGQVFQVDETGYAQILQQVRDEQFEKELKTREKEMARKAQDDLRIAGLEQEKDFQKKYSKQEQSFRQEMQQQEKTYRNAITEQEKNFREEMTKQESLLTEKDKEIERLKAQLANADTEKKLAVSEALQKKDRVVSEQNEEITRLQGKLEGKENESRLKEQSLKEQYENKLRLKDEQIEYYKDFKARQSTKMVGESLEQHCQIQFNQIRMTAFPQAYFEKDTDIRSGSKGDFIFREADENGTEFISIMFEMKNEMDTTATKHKNEDFFRELDKDRREKGCEYAVLVSLLEIDNELYNTGIVDVSYRYEKMYVIRPQFFIPMITLLRNAALHSLAYQKELQLVREQQIDILHFEENMQAFKDGFARNYRLASEKFHTAIDEIDKSITHLQKIKDALLSSENNLRLANNKAEDLSIKRLTKNAPSVREKFEELKESGAGKGEE